MKYWITYACKSGFSESRHYMYLTSFKLLREMLRPGCTVKHLFAWASVDDAQIGKEGHSQCDEFPQPRLLKQIG